MGQKIHECTCGAFDDRYLDGAAPGELFFVLQSRDLLAADLVREWATRLVTAYESEIPKGTMKKILEAYRLANAMERWPGQRKLPD